MLTVRIAESFNVQYSRNQPSYTVTLYAHCSDMSADPPTNSNPRQQAIEWLIAQNSGDWTDADHLALEAWLAENAEHDRQYRQLKTLWQNMDDFKALDFPQRAAAKMYCPQPSDNVVVLGSSHRAAGRSGVESKRLNKVAATLAASLLIGVVGLQAFQQFGVHAYQTGKGEQKTISLADGSQIQLNTDTEITIDRDLWGGQKISLIRGEALFDIRHDPNRELEVAAGNGLIRDIGTRFDVYAQPNRVDLAILEGKVALITPQTPSTVLIAGQATAYGNNGQMLASPLHDVRNATAWQNGKLVFADLPLPDVLAQISRYHDVAFIVADPKLNELRVSGTFKSANLQLLMETLEAGFPIKAEMIDTRHIRLSKARA